MKKMVSVEVMLVLLFAASVCYADSIEKAYKDIATECEQEFNKFSAYVEGGQITEGTHNRKYNSIKRLFLERADQLELAIARNRENKWADDAAYFIKFLRGNFQDINDNVKYLEQMLLMFPDFRVEDWSIKNLQAFTVFKRLRPFFILKRNRADILIVKKEIFTTNLLIKAEGIKSYFDIKERFQELKRKFKP